MKLVIRLYLVYSYGFFSFSASEIGCMFNAEGANMNLDCCFIEALLVCHNLQKDLLWWNWQNDMYKTLQEFSWMGSLLHVERLTHRTGFRNRKTIVWSEYEVFEWGNPEGLVINILTSNKNLKLRDGKTDSLRLSAIFKQVLKIHGYPELWNIWKSVLED